MDYISWIRRGLEKPGKTQAGLARQLGVDKSQVNKMLRGERDLKVKELPKIAEYLIEPLPTGIDAIDGAPIQGVKFMGTIDLNSWNEIGAEPLDGTPPIPGHIDARYPLGLQCFFKLSAHTTDGALKHGDRLICVPFDRFRHAAIANDLLICVRTKGDVEQKVLRRAIPRGEDVTLEPVLNGDLSNEKPEEVSEPKFLVIAVHRPLG